VIKNLDKYSETDRSLIENAYNFAVQAHKSQKRLSGDAFITHPLAVAELLSELKLDASTIAAALLHDTIEDSEVSKNILSEQFGTEISFLVDGVTKLKQIGLPANSDPEKIQNFKKMFFAVAKDVRVILIKLADRLHNMRTVAFLPDQDRKRVALETLEIYAPIAARLGMGGWKGELEDLAFQYAYPTEFSWLRRKVRHKYLNLTRYLERTRPLLIKHLSDAGVSILEMHARGKHYYSLYQKMLRRDMDPNKIHDIVAMRIIVPDVKSCYEALGAIHAHYTPLPRMIKDYIALPKPNGYQSIHTTVFCEKGKIVEIQIRTPQMHDHNEKGVAAHWAYDESGKSEISTADRGELEWINRLKDFLDRSEPAEDISALKIDFFKNRIFVLTPKGDVEDLPEGATPIDFAYAIHSNLGHAVKGSKINGKIAPIDSELLNGDVVEILKGKEKKPSQDWLRYVKTANARHNIRSWFANQKNR